MNYGGYIRFYHNNYKTDGIDAHADDDNNEKDSIRNQSTQIKAGNERLNIGYLKSRNKTEYDIGVGFPAAYTNSKGLGDTKLTKVTLGANKTFSNAWKSKLSISQTRSSRDSGENAENIGDKYKTTNIK